jgi:hypothetical protein
MSTQNFSLQTRAYPKTASSEALLYLIYTAGLPTSPDATSATFVDPTIASCKLQTNLLAIQTRLKMWMRANGSKSSQGTFTTRKDTCPQVYINDVQLPQDDNVKYLGLHFDRRLSWHKHIFAKRKQLGITLIKMYWLLGHKSKLSTSNKILIYKAILKPIWTYGIHLWSSVSTSNIEIPEHFQSKILGIIVNAPWNIPNSVIRKDLQIPTVKE